MTSKRTIADCLDFVQARLEAHSDTPGLDAQLMLARVLKKQRSWVLAHPEQPISSARQLDLEEQVARLEAGQPLPYVLGHWEFFGLDFEVTPDVLIPRPETELLVERALAWLHRSAKSVPSHAHQKMIDIGTGSGCIGISLAVNVPDLQVTASDISPAALNVARRNAGTHGVAKRIDFHCCDLFPTEQDAYDLIVANLPYIPSATLHKLKVYNREPALALDGGSDGLAVLRRLLAAAPDRLLPGGLLLMEIEASQGPAVLSIACDSFARAEIHLHKDLAGHDRLLEVQV